jgi:hypothetical protein
MNLQIAIIIQKITMDMIVIGHTQEYTIDPSNFSALESSLIIFLNRGFRKMPIRM